jgi:predicted aconitase with swiveling domain
MSKTLKGRSLSRGIVEEEALITTQAFSISAAFTFPLIKNSPKCKVADRTHELYKKNVKYKILIFPYPIGTTTLSFVLLETIVREIGAIEIICERGEPSMSSGALIADIFYNKKFPIIDQIEFSKLKLIEIGTHLRVNGDDVLWKYFS